MNRNRMLLIGMIALVLSGLVTYWAYRTMAGHPQDTRSIVVAAKRLPLGSKITEKDVTLAAWPKSMALKGTNEDIKQVVGRGVIIEMLQNDPVVEEKLTPKDAAAGLTAVIPEKMRAMAVKVDNVIGVAGFVLPGTKVDVIVTGQPSQNDDPTSKVILENVKVLTADSDLQNDPEGKAKETKVVTLLVRPDQAAKLALAAADGRIQLALRNPRDENMRDPPPIRKPELYFGAKSATIIQAEARGNAGVRTARPAAAVSVEREITLILGGKEQVVKVGGKKLP